uniref:Lon-insertion domain-containing protein n=1 Tax=Anaerobiospirillum succiniciproducens TaxID=13335 RepID=UPI0029422CDC
MKAIKFKLKDGSMSEEIKGVTMLESSDLYPAFPEQLYQDLDSSNSASPQGDAKLTEGDQLSDKIAPRSFASLQLRAKNAMRSLFALKRERMLVMCTGRLIDPLATAYDMVKEVSGIEAVIAYAPTKFELFGNDKEDGILTANYCLMSASGASVKLAGQARKSTRINRICDEGLFTTKQVTAAVVEEETSEPNNDSKELDKDDHKVVLTSLTSACQDGLFEAGTLAAASGQDDSHEGDAKSSDYADKAACSQGKANYNVIIMPCVHLIEHSKWLGMIDACLAENDALKLILVGDATDVAQLSLLWSTLDSAIHTDVVLEFPVVGALHTLGGLINHYRLNDRSGSDLLPFSRDALALLAAYSCRISGDRRYLGLTELSLKSLIYEANRFALRNLRDVQCPEAKENAADSQDHVSCSFVSRYHVLKAIAALDFRNNFLAESVLREH